MGTFYAVLTIISISGKAAIFFKKFIEYRKDNMQVVLPIDPHNHASPTPPIAVNPNNQPQRQRQLTNSQRWNQYLCGNSGTVTLLFAMFLIGQNICRYILNRYASAQLIDIFNQFLVCNVVPLLFYLTNDKLYQHVKSEIF